MGPAPFVIIVGVTLDKKAIAHITRVTEQHGEIFIDGPQELTEGFRQVLQRRLLDKHIANFGPLDALSDVESYSEPPGDDMLDNDLPMP